MDSREQVIRERLAHVYCSACNASYVPDRMVVLAHRPTLWIVMISCERCQLRRILVVTFGEDRPDLNQPPGSPQWSAVSRSHAQPHDSSLPADDPVTIADVHAIHDFLETFGGDFQAAFSRSDHHDRSDT